MLGPLLIALCCALAILAFAMGGLLARQESDRASRLKRRLASAQRAQGARPGQVRQAGGARRSVLEMLGRLGKRLGPQDAESLSATRLRLVQAGYRRANAHLVFWGVKGFLALILLTSVLTAVRLLAPVPPEPLAQACAGLLAATLGYYAPEIWLSLKVSGRRQAVIKELPDALDLLVVCVESGMGLDQAIYRVAVETAGSSPHLSEELKILNLEMRAGKKRQEAMRSLATRIGVEDMSNLVTLIIQSDMFGTSIAQTLRVYSDALRVKRHQRAEEKAATLPVKLLFPLIFCIFPALFVVIMGPAMIKIFFSS